MTYLVSQKSQVYYKFVLEDSLNTTLFDLIITQFNHLDNLSIMIVRIALFILLNSIMLTANAKAIQPNVLMIVLDDLNDYIGVLGGHPQSHTPNIDKLASESVLFTNAHANVPVCSPSRASFMNGISPVTSKYWGFTDWTKNKILMSSKSIPEYLRDNGYDAFQTGKVFHKTKPNVWTEMGAVADYGPLAYNGKKSVVHPKNPQTMQALGALDATFTSLANIPEVQKKGGNPGHTGWYNIHWKTKGPFHYKNALDRDLLTDEKSVAYVKKKILSLERKPANKPFFMGVGFIRPHTPLVVPQKYFDMFPLEQVKIPVYKENDRNDTKLQQNTSKEPRGRMAYRTLTEGYDSKEKALRTYIQAYLASVAFADDMVGQTLKALENSSFKDNTVVVLFSDHGYNMGEKEYLFKYCLWEQTTRVPLMIKTLNNEKNAGKKVSHPVSLIDIYPTLIDICNLEGTTVLNKQGASLDGFSLKPFLEKPNTTSWKGPDTALTIISSWKSKEPKNQHLTVRSERYRYIRYADGAEELYDHNTDPYEWNNLSNVIEFKKVKQKLYKSLKKQLNH